MLTPVIVFIYLLITFKECVHAAMLKCGSLTSVSAKIADTNTEIEIRRDSSILSSSLRMAYSSGELTIPLHQKFVI